MSQLYVAGVGGAQREDGLEVRLFGIPVDDVADFHALRGIARRQPYGLNKLGAFGLA